MALISTGVQTTRVLAAADLLQERGISATVLHVPTLKPLDIEAIVDVAGRARAVVTVEEHSIMGGLGGAVAEVLGERLPTRMMRLGINDTFGESGPNDLLLEKHGLTPSIVADAVTKFIEI